MVDPVSIGTMVAGGGQFLSGIGGLFGSDGPGISEQLYEQREHQQQLDWKRPSWIVHGAKQAGLHPLAVLGSQVAGGAQAPFSVPDPNARALQSLSDMGQGLGTAVNAYSSREEKALQLKSQALAVENQELQNQRLRAENAVTMTGRPAGMSLNPLMPGQADSGVRLVPKEDTLNLSGNQPGIRPSAQTFDYPGNIFGGPVRHMSQEASEATEDDFISKAIFALMYTAPDLFKNMWNNSRKFRQYKGRDLLPVFKKGGR